jgi:hypothetical protein
MFLRGLKMPGGAQDEGLQDEGAQGKGAQRRSRGGDVRVGDVRVGGGATHVNTSTNSRVTGGAVIAGASPNQGRFTAPRGGVSPTKAPAVNKWGKEGKSAGRMAASGKQASPTKGAGPAAPPTRGGGGGGGGLEGS